MINILSEYHAKNKDEKSEHAKGKESGKDAPHGTDEEKHHRQNVKLLKLYLAIENTLYLCIKDKINNEKSYRLYSCFY